MAIGIGEIRGLRGALEKAFTCPACGKSRIRWNTAGYRRPAAMEPLDPEKHCTCPDEAVRG